MEQNKEMLERISLSEKDFQLIIEGLDCLPNKDRAGDLIGDLFIGMLTKGDPEHKAELEAKMRQEKRQKQMEKEAMTEEIKILQGKLLMLKRYLAQIGALNEVNNIINHIS